MAQLIALLLPKKKCLHLTVIRIFPVLTSLVGGQMQHPRKEHPHQVTELLQVTLILGCMSDTLVT